MTPPPTKLLAARMVGTLVGWEFLRKREHVLLAIYGEGLGRMPQSPKGRSTYVSKELSIIILDDGAADKVGSRGEVHYGRADRA